MCNDLDLGKTTCQIYVTLVDLNALFIDNMSTQVIISSWQFYFSIHPCDVSCQILKR